MGFKNSLYKVFSSNVINLIIGIVAGFLIPGFLSINQYALYKTFSLYLGYVGLLHFGFIDGIFIKYGGKKEEDIDYSILKGEHNFLLVFQLIISVVMILIGFVLKDRIFVAFAIAILPINVQSMIRFLYQALGEFDMYSKIMIIPPILSLFAYLFNIFFLKIDSFWPFVASSIIINYLVFIGLELYFYNKFRRIKSSINFNDIYSHFKIGVMILIGNLSSMFFYSADKWFVKFSLTIEDFAYYSFAISMMAVINILISSVTIIFYPYLAREKDDSLIIKIKRYLLMIGTIFSGGYFIFNFIVNTFLTKYIPSLEVISILFAGYPAIIVINALYINLYKVKKQEKVYVSSVLKILIVSIILNTLAIMIHKSNLSIAIATTISFYIWYFYSSKDFSILKIDIKEIIYLTIFLVTFFVTTNITNSLIGMFIYFSIIMVSIYVFYKEEFFSLLKDVLNIK